MVKEKRILVELAETLVLGMTSNWRGAIIRGSPPPFHSMTNIKKIFGKKNNILIGMVHLPPLLSIKGFLGIEKTIAKALADLSALEKAGFDGALIENDNDKPHTEFANESQIASFSIVANEICKKAKIPIGVQMMLNDWRASFAIAKAVGAKFTRLDVFVDHVNSKWGDINPAPTKIIAYKNKIYPELLLLTDIQVKYKTMIRPRQLATSAKLAIRHGSDGLIITGEATGVETPIEKVKEVRKKFPLFSIFVGAGVNEKNIREEFSFANGAIVGTSIKSGEKVDLRKATRLKKKIRM